MKTTVIHSAWQITEEQYRQEVATATTTPISRDRATTIRVVDLTPEARLALLDLRVQRHLIPTVISAGGDQSASECAKIQWPAGVRAEAPTVADASAWLLGELAPRQCEAAAEMARAEAARAAEEAGAIAVEAYLRAAEERLAAGEPIGWSTSPHDLPDRPDTPWSVSANTESWPPPLRARAQAALEGDRRLGKAAAAVATRLREEQKAANEARVVAVTAQLRAYARTLDSLARAEAEGYAVEREAARHAIDLVRVALTGCGTPERPAMLLAEAEVKGERGAPTPAALDLRDRVIAAMAAVELPGPITIEVGRVSRCTHAECLCGNDCYECESQNHTECEVCEQVYTAIPVEISFASPYSSLDTVIAVIAE